MKIISLNTWGGNEFPALMDFVRKHSEDTDVFCFQEILSTFSGVLESNGARANLYQELSNALVDHRGSFSSAQEGYDIKERTNFPIAFGLAQFVRDKLRAEGGNVFVLGHRNSRSGDASTTPRNLQWATFGHQGEIFTIAHFHGHYAGPGRGKGDNELRLLQSKKLKETLAGFPGHKIFCGDLNLNPDTESLGILEEGMINLVKLFGITDTRGELYDKAERFADYMLISPELEERIKNFAVPNVAVSDHLPLILELED